jgi:hypothetical protein
MLKLISWNMAHRKSAWQFLAGSDADIALLQEAREPPTDLTSKLSVDVAPWQTGPSRAWRTAIVDISHRANVRSLATKPLAEAQSEDLAVSQPGTLAAATITPPAGDSFIAVSIYAPWEQSPAKPSRCRPATASLPIRVSLGSVDLILFPSPAMPFSR